VGSGSFGTVFKALNIDEGRIFAVKKMPSPGGEDEKRQTHGELEICKDLRHPHIVSYLGHEFADDCLYIHMEYLSGGSMASILKEFGALTAPLLKKATRGIGEGLDYLHSRSPPVVHRDIKGANVLVGPDFCVKLADFGCSKRSDVTASLTMVGSIPWMAPEVINQESGHGRKADVWSFGCVVIEMATAEKPWGSSAFDNPFAALKHIGMSDRTPPIPESLEESAIDFAAWCTKRSKAERPTSRELLSHSFIVAD
jgi:serine/threonine protein kinase